MECNGKGGGKYLLGVDDVHYYATLEHLGEAGFDGEGGGAAIGAVVGAVAVGGGEVIGHCC